MIVASSGDNAVARSKSLLDESNAFYLMRENTATSCGNKRLYAAMHTSPTPAWPSL